MAKKVYRKIIDSNTNSEKKKKLILQLHCSYFKVSELLADPRFVSLKQFLACEAWNNFYRKFTSSVPDR